MLCTNNNILKKWYKFLKANNFEFSHICLSTEVQELRPVNSPLATIEG